MTPAAGSRPERSDLSGAALDPRAIARRAASRALAERGLEAPEAVPLAGVHVSVLPPAEPSAAKSPSAAPRGRELIDAARLAAVPDRGTLAVPEGAIVTALAEEEALRRGIRLVRTSASGASAGSAAAAPGGARATLRVALGADHGGFRLKQTILGWLPGLGAVGVDLGTRDENPCDYPDFALAVALAVAAGEVDFGIVVDGAGIGSAMAANKVPGVRAANCVDVAMAKNAREHNFANVLTLGAKLAPATAQEIVQAFLATETGAERHRKRVEKINDIERRHGARRPQA